MLPSIRVAILDDHPGIVHGYRYHLEAAPDIQVVAVAGFGSELEPMLAEHAADVLLLDLQVPIGPNNNHPYPVLQAIERLLCSHRSLHILVISMYDTPSLIRSAMEAGASGYILKNDREAFKALPDIVRQVAAGERYLSPEAEGRYRRRPGEASPLTPRQIEVIARFAAYPDHTSASVAKELNIAHSTVRNLLSDAYERLGVSNRSAAIIEAQRLGIIPPLL